ncbi:MAG: TetR/AcrR family transcriptional regulator [Frankiales bacterium]|nr:MAG: TetR/AcrR family transcriptional regulator [Frankiales bacterium]
MSTPARRGRPPKLSRDQVVEAARDLVLAEGYDAVTVRRLAAELGVSSFAVHAHMRSKDELFDDVVTELIDARHTPVRNARSWQLALFQYALVIWETLLEHPTVVDVVQRRVTAPESVLPDLERIALLGERAGMSPSALAEVYETVWTFVLGYAATVHARAGLDELALRSARAEGIADDHPHAADLVLALAEQERVAAFPRRLRALIDALAARP